ncbi:hypothetical protein ABW20_dc0110514 [Dactylellina cionopaga]|nr:hypothetical protein ABW20_dc0110514 [Dactylellina cionopaga]
MAGLIRPAGIAILGRQVICIISKETRSQVEYIFDNLELVHHGVKNWEVSNEVISGIRNILERGAEARINDISKEQGWIPGSREGRTVLQVAADWFNDVGLLRLLVDHGADVNAHGDARLGGALQSCCRRPTTTISPGVTKINTVRFLVEAGANINPLDKGDKRPIFTPLDGAVIAGDLAVARYLLEQGACIDCITMGYSVRFGRLDMVSLLVQFDPTYYNTALRFTKDYDEHVIENYLVRWYSGQEPSGIPSESGMNRSSKGVLKMVD